MGKKELSFEQALERLEKIVADLEKGEVPLEQSMELFEEGTKLVAVCNGFLKNAEQKITELRQGTDGSATEVPFEEG